MKTLIKNARIVNEGEVTEGSILINGECIEDIFFGSGLPSCGVHDAIPVESVDAAGCFVLPGVIDDHVHFREPGFTDKADIDTETCAAAAGGVTSYFDMPNCNPQTTSLAALEEKFCLARCKSHVNYAFFLGATNDNTADITAADVRRIPGIKLFMGSSTGNMLVDSPDALSGVFRTAAELGVPLMTHCEDTGVINANMAEAKALYGDDPDVVRHCFIRSEQACFQSTSLAVSLARKYGTRLHIAHMSTKRELDLLREINAGVGEADKRITAEAAVGHLLFTADDHARLGTKIKVNPSIKTAADRDALRQALSDGIIDVVGTDHAPHLLSQKQGGCCGATSGMPMIQFSLVSMLGLVDAGVLTVERLVQLMCHNPATLFDVRRRGFLRRGYYADIVIVRPALPWTVTRDCVMSKCGWSPLEGQIFNWKVERTICNGHTVYADGIVDRGYIGEALSFR